MLNEPKQTIFPQEFAAAMGQHVSSVCVITTATGGDRFGLTATAVSSVCASPPRLLVCVNTSGQTHEKIIAAGTLCVNVLSEKQEDIAKAFAGMMGKDVARFSMGEWTTLHTGSPVLKGSAASLDCRIVTSISQFSHSVFICEVLATSLQQGIDPLLYGARRFRTLRHTMTPAATSETIDETLDFWEVL